MALDDDEDNPPLARVEMVTGELDVQPFARERPSTADDPFFQRLATMEDRILARLERRLDRFSDSIFAELGRANTHMTAQSLEIAADTIEPNGLTGKTVLLVEPDRYMRNRAGVVFSRLGMQHREARSSDEALVLIDGLAPFDVALVNLRSPHRDDGIELIRYLTRNSRSTVVAVMGGGLDDPEIAEALDGLRVVRLPMPFNFETMYERLYDAVGAELASRDTERPENGEPDFAEDETEPSIMLPSTGRETPEAKRDGS